MTRLRYWWRDLLDTALSCIFGDHAGCSRAECHCDCHFSIPPKHRHDYKRVGYGGAGWTLYRCVCGAEEINA